MFQLDVNVRQAHLSDVVGRLILEVDPLFEIGLVQFGVSLAIRVSLEVSTKRRLRNVTK